jgi:hypothetical protein
MAPPHPNDPLPQLPAHNSTATAQLFSEAFGADDPATVATVQPPPGIDSRVGQQVNVTTANDGPNQHFATDTHARVCCQQARQTGCQLSHHQGRQPASQPAAAANANNNSNDDDLSISSDVRADLAAEEAADGTPLWDDDAIDADIAHVIKSRIAPKSRKTYNDYTVRFIIFLFDQRERFPNMIRQDFLESLIAEHQEDLTNLTRAGSMNKMRKHIRKAIKDALEVIDGDDASTHPLHLADLTFRTVAHFLTTFSKKFTRVTVAGEETVVSALAVNGPVEEAIHVRLHKSSYDGVTSSLANLFKECKVRRDINNNVKDLWETIAVYKRGSTRVGARQRRDLGIRFTEGKDPMPFACYELLCSILHKSKTSEHVAAHLFLILDWNMLSRADAIVEANIELVGMSSDALRFDVGPTKTDQEGKQNLDHPFHVYSCPENPVMCPVLAMCKHLIVNDEVLKGKCKLFKGSNQYKHYNEIFRKIVHSPEYRQSFIDRGLNPSNFGTHSMRKGAATHIASGITSSPPIASICIRANWKMPGVMNRYIKFESAGDQYVGRYGSFCSCCCYSFD